MHLGKTLSVSGLIVFGTITSLFAKVVYELKGVGLDGKEKLFQKPWAMTTTMFIGMTFCLPVAYYKEWKQEQERKQKEDLEEPLLATANGVVKGSLKETLLLAIPSFFDLVATVLMNVGLLSVTASVYQMMRGAEMLFAALFAVLFLKRHLNRFHYMGIGCCAAGICMVGMSSVLSGEGSSTHAVSTEEMLLGMGLIVASQAVQAAQLTFEDFFMADLAMDPMKIVGFEGLFGSFFMLAILLPLAYVLPGPEGLGLHENTLDTLAMIKSSKGLQTVLGIDMFALLAYNMSGMMVTDHLGAVFRTVLETMRTLFVWLLGLLLFYTPLGMGQLGESWTPWSYLQAAGFVVLVAGTMVYGRGDEEATKQELSEAVAEAFVAAPTPAAATDEEQAPLLPPSIGTTSATLPIAARGVPMPSEPIIVRGSFKSTMNIMSGSYSRSFSTRSSLPRGSLVGGLAGHPHAPSRTDSDSHA
ncbi:hypothetical protein OEZ86_000868 [Tetradesmus obliquus]|nr:hypothetical protein OEZ86_000868 [Tetradesmus obliquus]